jgi:hypothetical protein
VGACTPIATASAKSDAQISLSIDPVPFVSLRS